jgi:hypothetical protein
LPPLLNYERNCVHDYLTIGFSKEAPYLGKENLY